MPNENRKPKIVIATWFNCLRNIKSSVSAFNLGYDIELITKKQGLDLVTELECAHAYKSFVIWETPSQLERALRESDADIIWCHNEPDLMTQIACEPSVKKGRMVIHDCHDLPTLHPGFEDTLKEQEGIAINGADHVFVPTDDYVDLIGDKYPGTKEKVHTLFSCPPETFFPDADLPRVNGMVYCGQVNVPEMESKLHYRNCIPLFQALTQCGVASHIYNTTPGINMHPYITAGACSYGTLKMYAAIHQYTRYDYGFVGSNVDCEEIQMCMPNKLFDCIAAGIPMIALNAKAAGKFITDNQIGISVQGIENLQSIEWGNTEFWEKCRRKTREIRYDLTAEKQTRKVFDKVGI